jgi:uncharacterized protein (TIGR00369 family)
MTQNDAVLRPIDNPFLEMLGVRLAHWTPDYAEMHLPVLPGLLNRTGRIHGGVICTLLDSVCGYCGLYYEPGQQPLKGLTLSLTTQFIGSTQGNVLVAKGFMQRRGSTVYFSRAEVWMDGTELLATAVGTFKYIRR